LIALSLLPSASDNPKPPCNRENAGRLWPDAANHDANSRRKSARCGELERCMHGLWRYHWESLTVRLDQLRGGAQLGKPAFCEESTPEKADGNDSVSATTAQRAR